MKLSRGQLLDISVNVFGLDVTSGVQLWEAGALLRAALPAGLPGPGETPAVRSYAETQGLGPYTPPPAPFPLVPTTPALIVAAPATDWPALAALLGTRYPAGHFLQAALYADDNGFGRVERLALAELPSLPLVHGALCVLHLPALSIGDDTRSIEGFRWVVTRLLAPGGCPWDVKQTHQSLRPALLEETHEVLEALDSGDMAALSEELGDLLIAIVAHSEMARQAGFFALEDVFAAITTKLIGRHPHVFGALSVDGEGSVLRNWEQIKAAELAAKGKARASALDGVPPSLPALAAAQKFGKKAARVGFNWGSVEQVWAKLREELAELAEAAASGDSAHAAEELGDALFVLTRLADWLGLDAETSLREANAKFRRRFAALETAATERGLTLQELPLDQLLALWNEAKTGAQGTGDANQPTALRPAQS
jgi:tetrapyrrole methylase family protein/MazG family protein